MQDTKINILKTGFRLFILGFRLSFTKRKISKMTDARIKHGKPLTDKKLMRLSNKYDSYLNQWNIYSEDFKEYEEILKRMRHE